MVLCENPECTVQVPESKGVKSDCCSDKCKQELQEILATNLQESIAKRRHAGNLDIGYWLLIR